VLRTLRNIAIIAILAVPLAFVPGGGNAAAAVLVTLGMAFLASLAVAARQIYRENQLLELHLDDDQQAALDAECRDLVERYLTMEDPTRVHPIGIELRLSAVPTPRIVAEGRTDRVDARGRELVVVDYKTGRSVCTDDEARGSQALALYVLGVRRTLRQPCARVELHHLPSGTVAAFEHTDRSLANHVRRAEDIAADIATATAAVDAGEDRDAAFPAVPGRQCSWCDFRPSCPVGQAAAPPRETWSFLAEDDEG